MIITKIWVRYHFQKVCVGVCITLRTSHDKTKALEGKGVAELWVGRGLREFPSQIFSGAFIAKVIFNEQPGYFVLKSALPKMCSNPSNNRFMICSLKMDPVLELAPVEAMTSSVMIWQWRSTPSCSFRGRAVNLRRATDHWPSERTLSSLRGTLLSSQFITRSKTTYPASVWSVLFHKTLVSASFVLVCSGWDGAATWVRAVHQPAPDNLTCVTCSMFLIFSQTGQSQSVELISHRIWTLGFLHKLTMWEKAIW